MQAEPGERSPVIIPEVNFTIAPDGGKSGYLRFLFIDPDGRESGDVRVIRVASGKLESMNRGEIIAGPDRGSVYASLGFLDELGNPYATVSADEGGRTARDWGVYGVPETFVVDGEGRVLARVAGPVTERTLERTIRPAIDGAGGS